MNRVSQKAKNKALEKGRSLVITYLSDSIPEKLRHDALHGIVQAIVELSPICVELLRTDETPEVGRHYTHSEEYKKKKAREYMRQYRADKKDQQAIEELKPRRSDLDALFEMNGRLMETADDMLQSALLFAFHLGLEKPGESESLIQFGTRVFGAWREAGFPLKHFGPDGTKLIHIDGFTGSLPTLWPAGCELPIDPDKVHWAEKLERDADRIQAHWLAHREQRWKWNPTTGYVEPVPDYERVSAMELLLYRQGWRFQAQHGINHPVLVKLNLEQTSLHMSQADLKTILEEEFAQAKAEIKRRTSDAI